ALQFHQVAAAVWLRPVPGDSLAAFHHTVVLGSPRRVPRNSYADTYQPQGQRGGQVAPRTTGTSVVHSQPLPQPPLSEQCAELVLHHRGGYLNEVAVGKNRESATPLLSIHQRFLAMRSFDDPATASGQRRRPPRHRAGARRVANSTHAGDRPGLEPSRAYAANAESCVLTESRLYGSSGSVRHGCARPPSGDAFAVDPEQTPTVAKQRDSVVHKPD